jgi:hypothetical protein
MCGERGSGSRQRVNPQGSRVIPAVTIRDPSEVSGLDGGSSVAIAGAGSVQIGDGTAPVIGSEGGRWTDSNCRTGSRH